jgi:hypothetical protein
MIIKSVFILTIIIISSLPTATGEADQSPVIYNPPTKQEDSKATESKKNPETQNHSPTTLPIIVNPAPSPPLKEVKDYEHKKSGKKENASWWNFSFTDALLALFTLGLVIVGWLQVRILRGTLKVTDGLLKVTQEQSKHMETSLAIAQKSADAAEKAVYATRETANVMRNQDRAYIFVYVEFDKFQKGSTEIKRIMTEGLSGDYKAIVRIVNHGKTPAIIKSFHYKIDIYTTSNVVDFFTNYWRIKSVIPNEGEIIESGKDKTFLFSFYVGPIEQQYFLDSGNPDLLCVGRVEYENVFQNIHQTTFCCEFRYLIADFHICEKYMYNERT